MEFHVTLFGEFYFASNTFPDAFLMEISDVTYYGVLYLHLMADDIEFKINILEDGGIRLDF